MPHIVPHIVPPPHPPISQVKGWYTELDKVRAKLLDAACIDPGLLLGHHALGIVRR